MKGFEMIDDQSGNVKQPDLITKPGSVPSSTPGKTVGDVLGDNFDSIMKLATDITEIRKIQVMSHAEVEKMEAARKSLLSEAEAYAIKKHADTNDIVQRMNIIRGMMADFYAQSNQQITGEDFRIIITEIVNQMGRVEHGGK
jgi:hypothetical protein